MKRFWTIRAYLLFTLILSVFILSGCGGDAGNGHWDQPVSTPTDITPPRVTVISPANLATGVTFNRKITATFSEDMKSATLTSPLSTFSVKETLSGTNVGGTVTYVAASRLATFTAIIPFTASTQYTATMTTAAEDLAGNALAVNRVWKFTTGAIADTTAPTVTITAPANGATGVALSQKVTATFSEDMDGATLISPLTTFSLKKTVLGTNVGGTVTYLVAGRIATFTPTAPLDASTKYTATITTVAKDDAGNPLAVNKVWSFTTGVTLDTTAPTITLTGAVDGAIGLPINRVDTAIFSESMDPATLIDPATAYTVKETLLNTPVDGAVTYIGKTATFKPDNDLKPNTKYTSTISTVATDLAGNHLQSGVKPNPWSWTTGAAADILAPTITLTNPADAAIGVSINTAINATFSEAMALSTMIDNNFIVRASGPPLGVILTGAVTYNALNKIITFTPDVPLDPGTAYTVTVTNAATDEAHNPLVVPAVAGLPKPNPWTFTTDAGISPPSIIVDMGAATSFALAATAGVKNTITAPITHINGDVVMDPNQTCNAVTVDNAGGFGLCNAMPPTINGTVITNTYPDTTTSSAIKADLNAAYLSITPLAGPPAVGSLGGGTTLAAPTTLGDVAGNANVLGDNYFTAGVWTSSAAIGISGDITLDGMGDNNAVFVFQAGSTLTTADGAASPGAHTRILLINGAKASNVWWQVGTSATLGTQSEFRGNILAANDITMKTGATSCGRSMAGAWVGGAGAFVFDSNVVSIPGNGCPE